jgi:hypothetical protein
LHNRRPPDFMGLLHCNGRHHVGMETTVIRKRASLGKLETKRPSWRDRSATERAVIAGHGMRRTSIVLPYNGAANSDIQCLRAERKGATISNRHIHSSW